MPMPSVADHPAYDPIMPLAQAAEYCARHAQTIRTAVRRRELTCIRRGTRGYLFFRLSDINAWLKRQEHRASRRSEV